MKKILIISFRFPPMGGIGSRRWVKFAKYLEQRGYFIHVLTVKYPYEDKINWAHDLKGLHNLHVHRIRPGCPIFSISRRNLFEKFCSTLFRQTIAQLWYYMDYAQQWGPHLLPYARTLIRNEGIKNVIATAPPFSFLQAISFLKIEEPEINLILDYRDPWNDDIVFEYETTLRWWWQKERSILMEEFSLSYADRVIFATTGMKTRYASKYRDHTNKFFVIHNGFDRDDYRGAKQQKCDKFNIVYTGGMAFGRKQAIPLLAEAIQYLDDEFINNNLTFRFCSNLKLSDFRNEKTFETIKKHFRFHPQVSFPDVVNEINCHRYCLTINSPIYHYAFGVKTFEYMALGKKLFLISNGGELYDLIRDKGLFVCKYDIESAAEALMNLKNDFNSGLQSPVSFPEFDLAELTPKVEALLIE